MSYLFSSESVSEGHPDKVADQISDAILDQFLAYDDKARVACESFVTTGQVVLMGEVRSDVYIDLQTIARNTIKKIGYTKAEYQFDGNSCGILTAIHEQSEDINRGVDNGDEDEQGAGDQGMMFGYATNETENLMPVSLDLAHLIMRTLAEIRKEGKVMTYLRPDAKSQVTIQYSDAGIYRLLDALPDSSWWCDRSFSYHLLRHRIPLGEYLYHHQWFIADRSPQNIGMEVPDEDHLCHFYALLYAEVCARYPS